MAKYQTTRDILLHPGEFTQLALDELVHEVASSMASDANNQGMEAQIEFLKQTGLGDMQIAVAVNEKDYD